MNISDNIPNDMVIEDIIKISNLSVKKLKEEGADIIVALTHLNNEEDIILANNVEGINLILGGHNHEPIMQFVNNIYIFKAGYDAMHLGLINLRFKYDSITKKLSFMYPPMILLSHVDDMKENDNMKETIKQIARESSNLNDIVVGITETELDTHESFIRTSETAFGNIVVDSMCEYADVDLCLINGGFIKGEKTYKPGSEITTGMILSSMPYKNLYAIFEVSGKHLKIALENMLAKEVTPSYPSISSGSKIVYDSKLEPGSRIKSFIINGKPIDPNKRYKLATSPFLLKQESIFPLKDDSRNIPVANQILIRDIVLDYIKKSGKITAKIDGRCINLSLSKRLCKLQKYSYPCKYKYYRNHAIYKERYEKGKES